MKKKVVSIGVFTVVILCIMISINLSANAAVSSMSQSDYDSRVNSFINDGRWKNDVSWGAGQGPKLSSWSSSGCFAYTADFVKYMFGREKPQDGNLFINASEIRAGDVVYADDTPHYIVVLSRSGNKLRTAEGNWGGKVRISDSAYYISGSKVLCNNWSGFYYNKAYHQVNITSPEPQPANLGDNFYAAIFHVDSGKAITYDNDESVGYVRLRIELGSAKQVWRFVRQADGAYVIASTVNNKLLEMTAGDTTNGVQVSVGSEDWGGYYQRWYIYEYDDGYIIKSKHFPDLNRVLDVAEGNTNDGTAIVTWYRQNTRNQIFNIYKGPEMMMTSPQLSVKTENDVTILSWGDIYGEASYFVHIYKDGALYSEKVIPTGKGCLYSESLPDGNYTAYVAAHNAFYAMDSNTVSFSILNGEKAPDTWIKADKNTYCVGDSAVFNFGCKYATSVSLGIDKDGKRYANPEVTGKTSYSYLLPETGTYSIYVSGWSQNGYEDSKRVVITVKERPPQINSSIESYSNTYIVKTEITSLKQSVVYVTALYSAEGKLLDVQTLPLSSGATTADIALPKRPDAKYIKVFLWDSLDNMEPLCDSETITL